VVVSGCVVEGSGESRIFGESEGGCGVTVLIYGIEDDLLARRRAGCPLEAVGVRIPTIPAGGGDRVPYRFERAGRRVAMAEDSTADEFVRLEVSAPICATVGDTASAPSGAGRNEARTAQFELTEGVWPP
jgi:hypothetical protein